MSLLRSAKDWAEIFRSMSGGSQEAAAFVLGDLTGYRDNSGYWHEDVEQLASALAGWRRYMDEDEEEDELTPEAERLLERVRRSTLQPVVREAAERMVARRGSKPHLRAIVEVLLRGEEP